MILHGKDAVSQVESDIGRSLTLPERRVVLEEGYSTVPYLDTKGILTGGVGQTGKWLTLGFDATVAHHEDRVRMRVPSYDDLPVWLRAELLQSEYRGDLGLSPKAVRLFNEGSYMLSSEEFLNNKEYRDPRTPRGIKRRLEATSDAIFKYGHEMALSLPA